MDLLRTIFERSDSLNGYWNLYIAVSFGLLGLMASAKPFTQLRTTKILLTSAFIVFAASNANAIFDINEQRRELIALVSDQYKPIVSHGGPPKPAIFVAYHAALDLAVILCIWLVPWHLLRDGEA